MLLFLLIIHAAGASWPIVFRRTAELLTSVFPILALALLPILFWQNTLYPWTQPAELWPSHEAHLLQHKKDFWLNSTGFTLRSIFYVLLWVGLAELLLLLSVRQDRGFGHHIRTWGAAGIPVMALSLTFASFDWFMSLEPLWYSTIYGVYWFAGGFLSGIALLTIVCWRLQKPATSKSGPGFLAGLLKPDHFSALGRLLLGFVIFWAYIAFSQLFIIWMADLPAEVVWYIVRLENGWGAIGLILLIAHFALPFLVLLSWPLKRRPALLSFVALWILIVHYIDVYWLIMPALYPERFHFNWLSPIAVVGLGALLAAWVGWRSKRYALIADGDPFYASSLRYSAQ